MDSRFNSGPGANFRQLSVDEFGTEFSRLWDASSKSFEKIEVCPVFVEDDDKSFDLFAAGKLAEAAAIVRERVLEQRDMYESFRSRGGEIRRFRVIGVPLTPYISDYEMNAYDAAASIGEAVRFVEESKIPASLQLACRDMLIFDRSQVLMHAYTPWGRLVGGYYSDEPRDVLLAVELLDSLDALSVATP